MGLFAGAEGDGRVEPSQRFFRVCACAHAGREPHAQARHGGGIASFCGAADQIMCAGQISAAALAGCKHFASLKHGVIEPGRRRLEQQIEAHAGVRRDAGERQKRGAVAAIAGDLVQGRGFGQ